MALFQTIALRSASNPNEFILTNVSVDIPDGVYDPDNFDPNDPESAILFVSLDGVGRDKRFVILFLGYEEGTGYPLVIIDDFPNPGDLDTEALLTNEPPPQGTETVTYTVDKGKLILGKPVDVGFVRFDNYAILRGDGPAGTYTFQGESRDIPHGNYDVGDPATLAHGGTDHPVELVGFHTIKNYPIFKAVDQVNGEELYFLLTDEPGAAGTTYMLGADEITADTYTTCFAPGTLIATPDGERAVETLRPGEEVRTADGGVATVKWVGMQKVSTIFGPREWTHPVRILAGALGENVPHTDLVVTKDHGMIVDGIICNAGALVNGTSIAEVPTRELDTDPRGVVTYYHVETESHAVLLANGAAAESFIDDIDRAVFGNYSEFVALYGPWVPDMIEMNMPRAMSTRQVPNWIKWRLIERAEVIQAPVARSA